MTTERLTPEEQTAIVVALTLLTLDERYPDHDAAVSALRKLLDRLANPSPLVDAIEEITGV